MRVPGTSFRVGLDALLGLFPGGGDLAGGLLSSWLIVAAGRLGAPPAILLRMGMNVGLDALLGAVPVLGDVFDFAWKANRKNLDLLERHLADPAGARRSSRASIALALGLAAAVVILFLTVAFLVGAAVFRWAMWQP